MSFISSQQVENLVKALVATHGSDIGKHIGGVKEGYLSNEIQSVMEVHALGAAASGLGVAALPGVGGAASMALMAGFIWSMYFKINKCLGLKLSKTLMKSLASAVLTNIAQAALSVVGVTILSTALSFIPGIGNVTSAILMAGVDFAVVWVSGLIYLMVLTKLFSAGKNPEELSESDLKATVSSVVEKEDVGKLVKSARNEYVKARKSGKVTGKETVDLESDD